MPNKHWKSYYSQKPIYRLDSIVEQIRDELKANIDLETQKSFPRFFKEKTKYYGVKTGIVGKIAKKYWK